MGWLNDFKKVLGIAAPSYTDALVATIVAQAATKHSDGSMSFEEYCDYLSLTGVDVRPNTKLYKKIKKEFEK